MPIILNELEVRVDQPSMFGGTGSADARSPSVAAGSHASRHAIDVVETLRRLRDREERVRAH